MLNATVITYLDKHSGAATVLLTAILVVINAYYAVQNWQLRQEARRAREEAVRPKLAIEFHRLGPTATTIAIRNVGPGVAFAIDVKLSFVPQTGDGVHERRWRANILESGAQADFLPPGELNDNLNGLPAVFREIALSGTLKDADGVEHSVRDEVVDLADWREALHDARQRFIQADSERRLAEAFEKPIKKAGDGVGRRLDNLTRAVYALRPAETEDEHEEGSAGSSESHR
jgi:hypothetical protein